MTRWTCQGCAALFGAWLSRCPRCGSAKELVVALNACTSCTTKFAVGLPKCPHCGSTKYVEDGQPMAKITAHGGPSDKTLPAEPVAEAVVDTLAAEPALVTDPGSVVEEGEGSSPGTSSSTSTEMPQQSSEPSSKPRRSHARKTGSRSVQDPTGDSSVSSMAGEKTTATSVTDSVSD